MLPHRLKLSYVAPLGLARRGHPLFVGFHPTLIYFAPSGLCLRPPISIFRGFAYDRLFRPLGLSFDKLFGSARISYYN